MAEFQFSLYLLCLVVASGISKKIYQSSHEDIQQFYKERQLDEAGFEDFTLTNFIEKADDREGTKFDKISLYRRKRSLEQKTGDIVIEFHAFDEHFVLNLQHTKSTIHPNAKIVITNGEEERQWNGTHPDCFLAGKVTSHDTGTVSLSYCHEIEGGMRTRDHEYHIETLPAHLHKRDTVSGASHSMFISRRSLEHPAYKGLRSIEDTVVQEDDNDLPEDRYRRDTYIIPSLSFTIELAVFLDAYFTTLFTYTDITRRIAAVATKYNSVQAEWARSDDLNYTVTIIIKYLNIFETDPLWYNVSSSLGTDLSQICQGAASSSHDPYDHVFLHTGVPNPSPTGLAYQSSICKNNFKCAVSSSKSLVTYIATAHEIGHNLGMYHDADKGCTGTNIGVMGSYGAGWSTCSRDDMLTYLQTGKAECLWETNIPNVPSDLENIALTGELIGQTLLEDEICEVLHGSGFRFREYPNFDNCNLFSCVDMNRGSTYGQMYKETSSISGNYCDEGKVCFKGSCTTLADAKLTGATVTTGGWSEWGTWSSCTRTCGTGVNFRRRICNSPRPKNHAMCTGDEYDAVLCNTTPCLGDSVDEGTLKTSRASETCLHLIQNGIINSTNYKSTGTVYNNVRMGKCEVKCDTQDGYSIPGFSRFGLMPDGSPCSGSLHDWDSNDWPRRPGYTDYCLEGYCQLFGCDNKINGQAYDQCGVCGGDNSTCLFYNSVFTDSVSQGDRVTIMQLPVGAFNIQFWFTYSGAGNNFIELWSKVDRAIIASNIGYSWVWDSRDNPIVHAGVYWTFYFNSQYLLGKGTLTDSVTIKFYNKNGNPHPGVNYAYSADLNAGSCSGTCENGGTWDSSICGCICPSGFYNANCSSTCNSECQNGGTVVESDCSCRCNNQSFGNKCQTCKVPFTGQACQSCVETTCLNCGQFDSSTCRCRCLDGWGGDACDQTCNDTLSTCADDAAAGACDTDNINMEDNCPLSCGLCVAKSPPDACLIGTSTTTAYTTTTSVAAGSTTQCPEFECTNGNCLASNLTCDGTNDCGDFSDEDNGQCYSNGTGTRSTSTAYIIIMYRIMFSCIALYL